MSQVADVRVHVASANTKYTTELCIRSMDRFAGAPYSLVVGDVGSIDGSLDMLRKLESEGWLTLDVAMGWRLHYEWLDQWLPTCKERYAVFVDSDVMFRDDGWLSDMVATATRSNAAMVCAEFYREAPDHVDPGSRKRMRLAARPGVHLVLLDVLQVADLNASFASELVDPADVPEGAINYDVGGRFLEALEGRGLSWVEMPPEFQRKYRHFGGMSWRHRTLWPGLPMAKRLAKIRLAVLMYRLRWRSKRGSGA